MAHARGGHPAQAPGAKALPDMHLILCICLSNLLELVVVMDRLHLFVVVT